MKVALFGYRRSGKTTLLQALSGLDRTGDVVAVPVPDRRLDALATDASAKKKTPVALEISDDPAGMPEGGGKAEFPESLRRAELAMIVLREFSDPSVPWHAEPDPARDYDAILTEMIVADLERIERRLERLAKEPNAKKPGTPDYLQATLFSRLKPELEAGKPISSAALDDSESAMVHSFQFLTDKPFVVVINTDEGKTEATEWEGSLAKQGVSVVRLCAVLERDLALMPEEERREFIEALGLEESARDRLVRAVYQTLDLVTFYTAGEKETRAWPLRKGATAWKAADTIHSDIARGFIRAEVVSYADFEALGSVKECYRQGKMRLEGKDYVVQDGDILHIRHKS